MKRDWIPVATLAVAGLPGIAALIALFFTYQAVNATNVQLRIAEQGQITDRYNAAITNLGSTSIEIRLGGIYALQRLMLDSPRDQSTVVAVLCAYVRDQTASGAKPKEPPGPQLPAALLPTDIQAALTVVGLRNTANDGGSTFIDLHGAQLANAGLSFMNFRGADFTNANLEGSVLEGTNFAHAYLTNTNLTNTDLKKADLHKATLLGANLNSEVLSDTNFADADFAGASLRNAFFNDANFANANFSVADLRGAAFYGHIDLAGADFAGADLTGADLTGADLHGANLGRGSTPDLPAKLRGVNLSGANLTDLKLNSVDFTGVNLTGAEWSARIPPPKGWVRDFQSGRLRRSSPGT